MRKSTTYVARILIRYRTLPILCGPCDTRDRAAALAESVIRSGADKSAIVEGVTIEECE